MYYYYCCKLVYRFDDIFYQFKPRKLWSLVYSDDNDTNCIAVTKLGEKLKLHGIK
jgi:hypothetical protein